MSLFTRIRDTVEGVGTAVAVGLPSMMISSGAAAATGLAGLLGGGGQIPQPSLGGGGGQASQSSEDFGPQTNLATLAQMIGQQQPQITATGNSVGGGGLI